MKGFKGHEGNAVNWIDFMKQVKEKDISEQVINYFCVFLFFSLMKAEKTYQKKRKSILIIIVH